jgi:hypothetical protein
MEGVKAEQLNSEHSPTPDFGIALEKQKKVASKKSPSQTVDNPGKSLAIKLKFWARSF